MILDAGDNGVHIWMARFDPRVPTADDEAVLSPLELDRANRFLVPGLRDAFVQRHAALRRLLARYTHRDPREVVFGYTERGKPFLRDSAATARTALAFNVSHSGELLLCAITAWAEVGVDVEQIRKIPQMDSVAKRVLSADEFTAWQALAPEDRVANFFHHWTRKEALVKATGEGIAAGLTHATTLELRSFHPARGYAAAVAIAGRSGEIQITLREMASNGDAR